MVQLQMRTVTKHRQKICKYRRSMITKLRQYIYVRVCQNSVVTWKTVTYDITVTTLLCHGSFETIFGKFKWLINLTELRNWFYLHRHCVKNVQIRRYFWSEYRKIRTRKKPIFVHFSCSLMVRWLSCDHMNWKTRKQSSRGVL